LSLPAAGLLFANKLEVLPAAMEIRPHGFWRALDAPKGHPTPPHTKSRRAAMGRVRGKTSGFHTNCCWSKP